ncbi:NAD(P)H-dependent oxidoreductase [Rhizobium sp. CFBP 8762]|uniref:NAD(P)H-dependent oxidoreductase n=1 Tax=Rhizobium sp. CFBP 8762 TaxID=2775279 RepID=UPI0017818B46|nr:NAD(P)H-dependent oxidoreductase [Rhizobium sp. CFBP 8762]MBD8553332.1 NAD(P)H-dependent oxidoreductase [Rhizobium sp. CFBP 8762]
MSKILILNGNPKAESLCKAIAQAYASTALEAGHEVQSIHIADLQMDFDPPNYRATTLTEGWVKEVQAALVWSEHVVIVTPLWWGGVPAQLKHLFDRVLLPGFAFRYRKDSVWWDRLLKGRSARVIVTADTPPLYFRWVLGWPLVRQLKRQILGFCGFDPVQFTVFGPVRNSSQETRKGWLAQTNKLARHAL